MISPGVFSFIVRSPPFSSRRFQLAEEQFGPDGAPKEGEAAAYGGDPRKVGREDPQKTANLAEYGNQEETRQQVGDQRQEDMPPP